MSSDKRLELISVDEYLAGELVAQVKHEYVAGVVYAMTGASNQHNRIATNSVISLGMRLRGKKCRPYNSDTKVRVQLPTQVRFYYPDASVVCQSNPPDDSYQDSPVVIVEVLSKSTRRIDQGEKKDFYLSIPTLRVYLLVEPQIAKVVAFRRTDQGFESEVYQGLEAIIPLPEIGVDLPLSELYEGAEFTPEVYDEESDLR